MARLDEIAEGIATVLGASSNPEPLDVDMRGQALAAKIFLIRAVIDSCQRRVTPLALVRVSRQTNPDVLKQAAEFGSAYEGIEIQEIDDATSAIRFYRFPTADQN